MAIDSKSEVLERLAASLGCSPEVFTGRSQSELSQTLELLTLWMATEDRAARTQVLAILHTAVADTGMARARALRSPKEDS